MPRTIAGRLAALVALLSISTLAVATAQRTFVSTAGSDANAGANCSIVLPCRGFAAAVGATTAGGEVIVLDSGGYGPVTINHSVTIEAPPGIYAGISVLSGTGVTVVAPGASVALRGLTITGLGGDVGIRLTDVAKVHIARCRIVGFTSHGVFQNAPGATSIVIEDTEVTDVGSVAFNLSASVASVDLIRVTALRTVDDAISASAVSSLTVRDAVLRDIGGSALYILLSAGGTTKTTLDSIDASRVVGPCVFVLSLSGGAAVRMTISRSILSECVSSGNTFESAIDSRANEGNTSDIAVNDVVIRGSGGDGIANSNNTGTRMAVSRSVIVGSVGFALHNGSSGIFYSRQDNTIRGNNGLETTGQTSGTITLLPPL